jgi:hypothetical protein
VITKEMVIEEINKLPVENLEVVYRIIRALESPSKRSSQMIINQTTPNENETEWHTFIHETYGCLADANISRGDQGVFETRENF